MLTSNCSWSVNGDEVVLLEYARCESTTKSLKTVDWETRARIERLISTIQQEAAQLPIDEHNFSISKDDFPEDIVRIFFYHEVVTYVYRDGRVRMNFLTCLKPEQSQMIEQLRAEIKQSKQRDDDGGGRPRPSVLQTALDLQRYLQMLDRRTREMEQPIVNSGAN